MSVRALHAVALLVLLGACPAPEGPPPGPEPLTTGEFQALLTTLARSWETLDTEAALALFAPDAHYVQPPDVQMFVGHAQLRAYFGALMAGTFMRWHNVWFNGDTQVGAGEFSFGTHGQESATHGVAVIRIEKGRITSWHEYLQRGPASHETFLSTQGKRWQWHIGNYP